MQLHAKFNLYYSANFKKDFFISIKFDMVVNRKNANNQPVN